MGICAWHVFLLSCKALWISESALKFPIIIIINTDHKSTDCSTLTTNSETVQYWPQVHRLLYITPEMIMKPMTTNTGGKLAAVQKELYYRFREAGLYTNQNKSPSRMESKEVYSIQAARSHRKWEKKWLQTLKEATKNVGTDHYQFGLKISMVLKMKHSKY